MPPHPPAYSEARRRLMMALGGALALAGCGGSGRSPEGGPIPGPTPPRLKVQGPSSGRRMGPP